MFSFVVFFSFEVFFSSCCFFKYTSYKISKRTWSLKRKIIPYIFSLHKITPCPLLTVFVFIKKGLSNMCNIAHVKETKNSKFLLKNNNYLLKNYILNTKCTNSNTKLLF